MSKWVASYKPQQVVMESTGVYWQSPYAALEKNGIIPRVVNARHVKQVPGRKTDIADAQWLAILARSGLLRGSFVPPADLRSLRLVSRHMQKLTGQLISEKNRLHKFLTDGGIRLATVVSDLNGKAARAMVKGLARGETPDQLLRHTNRRLKATSDEIRDSLEGELTDDHRFVITETLEHIEDIESRIDKYAKRLVKRLEPHQLILQTLQTIPGVDERSAAMLIVEIGTEMEAFGSAEKLAAWAGVCPANNESAGKRLSGKTRKGNPSVRRILCESAQAASRTRCSLQEKYRSLSARRGKKRAIFALAHKLLKIVFVLISRGDYYRDSMYDYEALSVAKNAPRWTKMLRKYGYIAAAT